MQQTDFYFAFAYNYRNGRIMTCKNSSCVSHIYLRFIYLFEDSSVHHLTSVNNSCGIRSPEHVKGSSTSSAELEIGKEMPMFCSKS